MKKLAKDLRPGDVLANGDEVTGVPFGSWSGSIVSVRLRKKSCVFVTSFAALQEVELATCP